MQQTREHRERVIREHITWCIEERDTCEKQLASMEGGTLKAGHMSDQGMLDYTPAWMARHRNTIEQMNCIVAAYRKLLPAQPYPGKLG